MLVVPYWNKHGQFIYPTTYQNLVNKQKIRHNVQAVLQVISVDKSEASTLLLANQGDVALTISQLKQKYIYCK